MGIHPLITALESGAPIHSCRPELRYRAVRFRHDPPQHRCRAGLPCRSRARMRRAGLRSRFAVRLPRSGRSMTTARRSFRAQSRTPLHRLFDRRALALRGKPSAASILSGRHSRDGEDAVLLPGQSQCRHSQQPLRTLGKPWPWSIKLEGSHRVGSRKVSLIHLDPADLPKISVDVLVYGRNGVQARPVSGSQQELGIIVEATGKTREAPSCSQAC